VYVRHVANQATHYLAKFALLNLGCVWIEDVPSCVSVVLVFDLMRDIV